MCLAVVCIEDGFSQIQSHTCMCLPLKLSKILTHKMSCIDHLSKCYKASYYCVLFIDTVDRHDHGNINSVSAFQGDKVDTVFTVHFIRIATFGLKISNKAERLHNYKLLCMGVLIVTI